MLIYLFQIIIFLVNHYIMIDWLLFSLYLLVLFNIINYSTFIFMLIFSFHILLLFLLSLIPSINLCSVAFSSISNNFECGFYSIIISSLRYRFNYWLILFHFPISEQESILAPLYVYGIQTLNSNYIIIILYLISFIDLLFFILDKPIIGFCYVAKSL